MIAWRRVAILGTGLIGGSFAAALRTRGLASEVRGFGPQSSEAHALGLVDLACEDIAAAVADAELVVLAAPPSAIAPLMRAIAPHLARDALLTDMTSTKQSVVLAARAELGSAFGRFVPGHPIAGSERQGPAAANAQLFEGARCVLCPQLETDAHALERVRQTWSAIGAKPACMTAHEHDEIFAAVSHLPHVLAFALAASLADRPDGDALLQWAGGGLRDTSRIAASSPALWADILLDNGPAVTAAGKALIERCEALLAAITQGDRAGLEAQITHAAQWRRRLPV